MVRVGVCCVATIVAGAVVVALLMKRLRVSKLCEAYRELLTGAGLVVYLAVGAGALVGVIVRHVDDSWKVFCLMKWGYRG